MFSFRILHIHSQSEEREREKSCEREKSEEKRGQRHCRREKNSLAFSQKAGKALWKVLRLFTLSFALFTESESKAFLLEKIFPLSLGKFSLRFSRESFSEKSFSSPDATQSDNKVSLPAIIQHSIKNDIDLFNKMLVCAFNGKLNVLPDAKGFGPWTAACKYKSSASIFIHLFN